METDRYPSTNEEKGGCFLSVMLNNEILNEFIKKINNH